MIEPTESDIGRKVVYTRPRDWGGKLEEGVVTSFNSHCVFVRYGSDYHSKGTNRNDLEWVTALSPRQTGGRAMSGYEDVEAELRVAITWTAPNLPRLMELARLSVDALADMRRQRDRAQRLKELLDRTLDQTESQLTEARAERDEALARIDRFSMDAVGKVPTWSYKNMQARALAAEAEVERLTRKVNTNKENKS